MYSFSVKNDIKLRNFVTQFLRNSLYVFILLILLLFLPWRQTIQGTGILIALNPMERNYKISSTVDGFIENIYVKENQFVKKGDKLFQMRDLDEEYQSRLSSIKDQSLQKYDNEESKLENMQKNLQNQQEIFRLGMDVYERKITQLQNNIFALKEQEIAIQNSKKISKSNYLRYKTLFEDGIVSQRDLDLQRNSYLDNKAKYQNLQAKTKNLNAQLKITAKEKEKYIHEMKLKLNNIQNLILNSQNNIQSFKQNIERNSAQLSRYLTRTITSKTDGYVLRIYENDKNKLIKRGDKILYFNPVVTHRAIRLKISDFNMPLMKEGLKVQVLFYGWPALQISGWPKISKGTYHGVIQSVEKSRYEKGFYYAILVEDSNTEPWPPKELLRIGTQSNVWVSLADVTIWYEMWRLMFAQPPKMVETPMEEKL